MIEKCGVSLSLVIVTLIQEKDTPHGKELITEVIEGIKFVDGIKEIAA